MTTARIGSQSNWSESSAGPTGKQHYVPPNQTNGRVIVALSWTGATITVSTLSLNGVSILSSVVDAKTTAGTGSTAINVQCFHVKAEDLGGSGLLDFGLSFSATNRWSVEIVNWDCVHPTTPFGALASAVHSGTHTSVSCAPASAVGDQVFVAFGSKTGTPTPAQTRIGQLIAVDTWGAASYAAGAAGTTSVSYSYASTTANAAIQAFAIKGQDEAATIVSPVGNSNRVLHVQYGPPKTLTITGPAVRGIPFCSSTEESTAETGLNTETPILVGATIRAVTMRIRVNTRTTDTLLVGKLDQVDTSIVLTATAGGGAATYTWSGSVHANAGQKLGWGLRFGSGTGDFQIVAIGIEYEPDDSTATYVLWTAYATGDPSAFVAVSQNYNGINGTRTVLNTAESGVRSIVDGTITGAYGELYVISAAERHTLPVQVGVRKNGAWVTNNQWLQSPITAAPPFHTANLSGEDSIVIGDTLSHSAAYDPSEVAGKKFGIETYGVWFKSAEKYTPQVCSRLGGVAVTGASTRFLPIAGEMPSPLPTTEADAEAVVFSRTTFFRLQIQVSTDGITSGGPITFWLRRNGARTGTALRFAINGGTAERYLLDYWNTETYESGDRVCIEVDAQQYAVGSSVRVIASQVATTVSLPVNLRPGPADIALAGHAPAIGQPISVAPGAAAVVLQGQAPTVAQPATLIPGAATAALAGHAPQVSRVLTLAPGAAIVVLAGHAPVVDPSAPAEPLPQPRFTRAVRPAAVRIGSQSPR